jgi:alcohol dehydrogenase
MVLYMRALIIHAPHVATISEINTPTPPSEWTLVKTLAVGICGTDKAYDRSKNNCN